MHLTRLRLENFRNLEIFEWSPGSSVNLIGGDNGAGKTSILEAIFYACTARSFRASSDDLMIRKGAEIVRIVVEGEVNGGATEIEIAWGKAHRRQIKIDGVKVARVAELFSHFHAVCYVPEDTELILGSPASRRRLLDLYLSQADRSYLSELLEYNRILSQRNAQLKEFEIGEDDETNSLDLLDVWDQQLASVGSRINGARLAMLNATAEAVDRYHRLIAKTKRQLCWRLESSLDDPADPEVFRRKLTTARKRDLYLGATTTGPHRDDVAIEFDAQPMRGYASQGEAKSMALAIKFALYEYLAAGFGEAPLLLLDEITSDLDTHRLDSLMSALPALGQVFLTTAKPQQLRLSPSIQAEITVGAVQRDL